ncbi:hypothetical protein BD414DRAFT_493265 [Trametes punicea]|nr:hypothetical protein BD414DRAFT_493265 [Trametes punicea]
MATVTETLPADIAPLATPLLLGYLLNWGLYGVLSVQVYLYHLAFPRDGRIAKTLVYSIYAIETAQTIIIAHDAFNAYGKGYGNLNALGSAQTEWLAVPIFSGIVSATVQMYYAYRVSLLSGSRLLGLVISAIALLQGSSAIAQGAQAFKIGNFADLASKAFVSCTIWLAGSAACDIIIAACMTFFLVRKDTKVPSTHAVITKLVRLIIETGILTALAATIDITLFLAFPHNAYHGCIALTLAKLYSNSLLVLFNSRIRIVGGRGMDASQPSELYASVLPKSQPGTTARTVNFNPHAQASGTLNGVQIHEQTWVATDSDSIELKEQSSFSKKLPSLEPEA